MKSLLSVCYLEAVLLLGTSLWSFFKLYLNNFMDLNLIYAYLSLILFSGWFFCISVNLQDRIKLLNTNLKLYRFQVDSGILTGVLLPPLVCISKVISTTRSTGIWEQLFLFSIYNGFSIYLNVLHDFSRLHKKTYLIKNMEYILLISIVAFGLTKDFYFVLFSILIFQLLLYLILFNIPGSFTLGELSLAAQGISYLLIQGYLILANRDYHLASNNNEEFILLVGLLLGTGLIGFLTLCTFKLVGFSSLFKRFKILRSLLFYLITFLTIFGIVSPLVTIKLGVNPFIFIFHYITKSYSALLLIIYWIVSALAGIYYSKSVLEGCSLNTCRKYFHGLATLMFIPGYFINRKLLYIAFAVALAAFIILEYIRSLSIEPLGSILHVYLSSFADEKDPGVAILAHIYLLVGCALPIWLHDKKASSSLSGILVLGLADAAASMIGKKYGRKKWPESQKTIMGTIGFIFALLSAFLVINTHEYFEIKKLISMLIVSITNGLLEAWSLQNDNIVLPLYLFAAIEIFRI